MDVNLIVFSVLLPEFGFLTPLIWIKRLKIEDAFVIGCILALVLFSASLVDTPIPYITIMISFLVVVCIDYFQHIDEYLHERTLAAKRRERERIEADRGVFNADQGFTKQNNLRDLHEERWHSDADAARAK